MGTIQIHQRIQSTKITHHGINSDQLLKFISEAGVKVSTCYDVGHSNFEDCNDHIPRIWINLINVVHPLDIVWELMHEYGHYMSGKRKPGEITLESEILAWSHADRTPLAIVSVLHFDKNKNYRMLC